MNKHEYLTNTNSFQKWAYRTLRDLDLPIEFTGNWISINGEPIMSVDGVRQKVRPYAIHDQHVKDRATWLFNNPANV